jgi:hypothetical protein
LRAFKKGAINLSLVFHVVNHSLRGSSEIGGLSGVILQLPSPHSVIAVSRDCWE